MDRREVEEKLAAADVRRREAQERLEQNAARLAELDDERAALMGDLQLAKRAASDYEERLARLRAELDAVEMNEARAALRAAVGARDAAAAEGAAAAAQVMDAFDRLASARAEVSKAHDRLRALDREAPSVLPPEPSAFEEQWRALAPMVEAELGIRLESELVEAAIRSPNSLVLDDLPQHLRELARQRKRDLIRGANRNGDRGRRG